MSGSSSAQGSGRSSPDAGIDRVGAFRKRYELHTFLVPHLPILGDGRRADNLFPTAWALSTRLVEITESAMLPSRLYVRMRTLGHNELACEAGVSSPQSPGEMKVEMDTDGEVGTIFSTERSIASTEWDDSRPRQGWTWCSSCGSSMFCSWVIRTP